MLHFCRANEQKWEKREIPCGRGTWFMKETGIQLRGNLFYFQSEINFNIWRKYSVEISYQEANQLNGTSFNWHSWATQVQLSKFPVKNIKKPDEINGRSVIVKDFIKVIWWTMSLNLSLRITLSVLEFSSGPSQHQRWFSKQRHRWMASDRRKVLWVHQAEWEELDTTCPCRQGGKTGSVSTNCFCYFSFYTLLFLLISGSVLSLQSSMRMGRVHTGG